MKNSFSKTLTLWLALAMVPASANQVDIEGAVPLYKQFCAHCHGINMVNPGTASYDLRKFPRDQKSRFIDSVMDGRGKMPPWGDILTDAEVELLWRYVATRAGKEPMPADDQQSSATPPELPQSTTIVDGTLSVCLAENGGVWSSQKNGGQGFEYLLSQQVAENLGLNFEPVWYNSEQEEENTPARDQNALLAHGVCDLVSGVALYATNLNDRSGDRAAPPRWQGRPKHLGMSFQVDLKPIAVTAPYARNEMAVVLHESVAPTQIERLADLDGLKIGLEQGTLSGALMLHQGTQQMVASAVTLNPGPGFLHALENATFDAALVSVSDFDRHRLRNPDSKLVLTNYRHRVGFNIAFAALADNIALIELVNDLTVKLQENGYVQKAAKTSKITYHAPALPRIQPVFTRRDLIAAE